MELMAAEPTGWSNPFFVTTPIPSPPRIRMPASFVFFTRAPMYMPWVVSGSSPASFLIMQETELSSTLAVSTDSESSQPFGVEMETVDIFSSDRSMIAAALAAPAAQEPVVNPYRRRFPPFSTNRSTALPLIIHQIEDGVQTGDCNRRTAFSSLNDDGWHIHTGKIFLGFRCANKANRHCNDKIRSD